MTDRVHKATLSQSQGREGWSIAFRHPVRPDKATGKPPCRVRMGLGTSDRMAAEGMVDEMNHILADRTLWDLSARPVAEARFSPRIVEIFYFGIVPELIDFSAIRDDVIPLPSSKDTEYRRVLLLGTTGVGKTTLVRQLLGTHPTNDRFPSTSTAKTTVAETELLLDTTGSYRVVVTFLPFDLVRDYVEECLSEAVLAAYRGQPNSEILRRVLSHVDQRFRLNYILGNGVTDIEQKDEPESEPQGAEVREDAPGTGIDLTTTNSLLSRIVAQLPKIASRTSESLHEELKPSESDARVVDEIFEECLYQLLRDDDEFQSIAEDLMDEIAQRFKPLSSTGALQKTKQGWPRSWHWETKDRERFLGTVLHLSSNHPSHFGSLLTPVVNGIRVAGPFGPQWLPTHPKLVLLDGEGLGHTPDSATSLPTSLSRKLDEVDAILLVDSAKHPLQAAPVAAMREVVSSGNSAKLIICFTHMDTMDQDTLPTFKEQKQHVLDSVTGVLTAIGEQLGRYAERALSQRFEAACFFVGDINQELDETKKNGKRTIKQFNEMLNKIENIIQRSGPVVSRPIYDRAKLAVAIIWALNSFHDAWSARLGLPSRSNIRKAHWKQIWALARRLAEGWDAHYFHLHPIADLHRELKANVNLFVQSPANWTDGTPSDDEKQQVFDEFANFISSALLSVIAIKMRTERVAEWQHAFNQSGRGSSYTRATIIKSDVYEKAAPIPSTASLPDRYGNQFLMDVLEVITQEAEKLKIIFR